MARFVVENKYIESDIYTILKINNQKYGEFEVLIDKEDIDKCKSKKWYINKFNHAMKRDYYYVVNGDGLLLHRLLMEAPKGLMVDHIDGKVEGHILDNRKQNLQICTVKENSRKSQFRLTNKSGHSGVFWYHYNGINKWVASIVVDYKTINLGYYDDIEDAIRVREKAEIKYFGEFKPISNCLENTGNTINT